MGASGSAPGHVDSLGEKRSFLGWPYQRRAASTAPQQQPRMTNQLAEKLSLLATLKAEPIWPSMDHLVGRKAKIAKKLGVSLEPATRLLPLESVLLSLLLCEESSEETGGCLSLRQDVALTNFLAKAIALPIVAAEARKEKRQTPAGFDAWLKRTIAPHITAAQRATMIIPASYTPTAELVLDSQSRDAYITLGLKPPFIPKDTPGRSDLYGISAYWAAMGVVIAEDPTMYFRPILDGLTYASQYDLLVAMLQKWPLVFPYPEAPKAAFLERQGIAYCQDVRMLKVLRGVRSTDAFHKVWKTNTPQRLSLTFLESSPLPCLKFYHENLRSLTPLFEEPPANVVDPEGVVEGLSFAVSYRGPDVAERMRWLLESVATASPRILQYRTREILATAVRLDNVPLVKFLLDYQEEKSFQPSTSSLFDDSDSNSSTSSSDDQTLLRHAVENGSSETLSLLLSKTDLWNFTQDVVDGNLLHLAAKRNFSDVLETLLATPDRYSEKFLSETSFKKKEVWLCWYDIKGKAALHIAVEFGNLMATLTLLKHGASPDQPMRRMVTASSSMEQPVTPREMVPYGFTDRTECAEVLAQMNAVRPEQ